MLTVALNKAQFIAPVGLYPQEAVLYNDIEVDLAVTCAAQIDDLPFIDYVALHQLVKQEVLKGEQLLEKLMQQIVQQLRIAYPDCKVRLSIRKCHPPLAGAVESSMVCWED